MSAPPLLVTESATVTLLRWTAAGAAGHGMKSGSHGPARLRLTSPCPSLPLMVTLRRSIVGTAVPVAQMPAAPSRLGTKGALLPLTVLATTVDGPASTSPPPAIDASLSAIVERVIEIVPVL